MIQCFSSVRRLRTRSVALLSLILCAFASLAFAAESAPEMAFDIPADSAVRALKQFSVQSGQQLLYSNADLAGVTTNAVQGKLSVDEALKRLLADTALIATRDSSNGSVAVGRSAPEKPSPNDQAAAPRSDRGDVEKNEVPQVSRGASNQAEDDLFVLSPFMVSADEDSGYAARDTLAGTRIRTRLEDVGSSISVITKQFLEDTNSNAIESLLVYTPNTEVSAQGGNFLGKGDSAILTTPPGTTTRVRGLTSADTTRDLYLTNIPFDSYNTGRVDIQRGPNSILYGIGSAGGIINSSPNQAAFKDSRKVSFQVGSYDSMRLTADFNQVLIKNELALRASFLDEARKYRQDPSFRDDRRFYAALRWDPRWLKFDSARTSFRANYEKGHISSNLPRQTPPIDRVTPFFTMMTAGADGTKLQNPRATSSALYNDGNNSALYIAHGGQSSNAAAVVWDNSGFNYAFYSGQTNATNTDFGANNFYRQNGLKSTDELAGPNGFNRPYAVTLGAYKAASLTDRTMFDFYNHLLEGPNKHEFNKFDVHTFALEQTFLNDKLGFELGYHREKSNEGRTAIFNDLTYSLTVDFNTELPYGIPNPHAGELVFVSSPGNNRWTRRERENLRATAFADLDFNHIVGRDSLLAKILGRNVFTGLGTRMDLDSFGAGYSNVVPTADFLDTAHRRALGLAPGSTLPSFSNGVYYWGYIGSPNLDKYASPSGLNLGGIKQKFSVPTGTTYRAYNRLTGAVDVIPFNVVENIGRDQEDMFYTTSSGVSKTWERIDSQAIVWQGYWLGGNLVPMAGWRKDKQIVTSAGGAPNSVIPGYQPEQGSISQYDIFNPNWFAPHSEGDISRVTSSTPPTYRETEVKSKTYSLVAHTPEFIRRKLPGRLRVSLFYNQSENIRPSANRLDLYGRRLPNPNGETEEYGVMFSALEDKLSLRVTKYRTLVQNDTASGSLDPNFQRVARVEIEGQRAAYQQKQAGETGVTAGRELYAGTIFGRATDGWYLTWRPDGPLLSDITQYTQAQIDATAAKQKAAISAWLSNPVPDEFVQAWQLNGYNNSNPLNLTTETPYTNFTATATVDTLSEGYEAELIARPVRGWDISLNASKTFATRTNLAKSFSDHIEARYAFFQGPAGGMRMNGGGSNDATPEHGGTTARSWYNLSVMSSYFFFRATEGAHVSELRPWSANLTSNYSFQNGFLKGVRAGGSFRWAEGATIGYRGQTINGIDSFDIAHPIKGPAQKQLDLSVSYERKSSDSVRWRIQLNVRNVFAKDTLIPVTVQPTGEFAGFRIPEPTTWSLTNSFDF